jgi:hypothetical protein
MKYPDRPAYLLVPTYWISRVLSVGDVFTIGMRTERYLVALFHLDGVYDHVQVSLDAP